MHIKLITNPAAGRGRAKTIAQVKEYLTGYGATVNLFETDKRGDARQAAMDARIDGTDIVVAAGGDGTINEVANGLAGSTVSMGILPLGTVNVFALETGIPMEPLKACDIILNGARKKLSLGIVNGQYFLLMAGIGFDAYVVYGLDLRLKSLSGRLSYLITAMGSLFRFPGHPLNLEIDNGEILEGYSVIVGNGRYYGGKVSVTPFADLERADLDVCVFKGRSAADQLRYAWGVFRRRHLGYSDVEYRTVKSLKVSSAGKTYIQADGDVTGQLPAEFSVMKDGITVILPLK